MRPRFRDYPKETIIDIDPLIQLWMLRILVPLKCENSLEREGSYRSGAIMDYLGLPEAPYVTIVVRLFEMTIRGGNGE